MLRNCKVLGPRKALKGKFNGEGLRIRGGGERRVRDKNLCCAAILLYSPLLLFAAVFVQVCSIVVFE